MPEPLDPAAYRALVRAALSEDVGSGDITTAATVPAAAMGRGVLLAKSSLVLCGADVAREVFASVDPHLQCEFTARDGDWVTAGESFAAVSGRAASLLVAERTALNFMQYLSGIATTARAYVEAAGGDVVILDTRKTTPTLRALAKYAVRCGGGSNHRIGLYDGVLIKDNHIRLAGGITQAVNRVRAAGYGLPIEVETQDLAQVDEAVDAGADIIMLDNFSDATMREAIARVGGRAQVELSGNMTLERVRVLAALGADSISVGAITHSAQAADISFDIEV
ncbi:MAG: carboxylating nicotinate-nucleotide diphosphorylase [Vicinamibacterales bacterium]